MSAPAPVQPRPPGLAKAATGIAGLDEVTFGGLPQGRPTLLCGGAGSGKTMIAFEFLARGAVQFGEPGVFVSFEETAAEIADNVRSQSYDVAARVAGGRLALDHARVERSEIEETGEYDLEGLSIRLEHAVARVGARRLVFDTIEALFAGLPDHVILRAELRRLFRWTKARGLTTLITGERGDGKLTRYGLEKYRADCAIVLDHRVTEQVSTRRLRVARYRGSAHGTNEYPFLIGDHGVSVLPITSLRLDHAAPAARVGTCAAALDDMLGGQGCYCGASVRLSGSAGTGKSSLGCMAVDAARRRGERALLFAFEESALQMLRNRRSIGVDPQPWLDSGLLHIQARRPTFQGLEQHLLTVHEAVDRFDPAPVLIDPISKLTVDAHRAEVKPLLMRLIDLLRQRGITALYTCLTGGQGPDAADDPLLGVSSLMDIWLLLRNLESDRFYHRSLCVLKSRGMAHSNQVRGLLPSPQGV